MEKVYTKNAPDAIGPYSQAVKVNGLVFTSGQIAINPATGNVEAATIEAQTEQVCTNLKNVLEASGSSLEKAVKTYARKLAPSMTRAEYYGNLLASRGITKEDLPQIIASVIGTEKDSVEKEIDEMLQRL